MIMSTSPSDVTQLLHDWKNGDRAAVDALTPLVYDELRRLAAHYLYDEHSAATLQPTSLVNEAYIRLVSQKTPDWESRSHFFGVAAHLMRQILVDHARKHRTAKRGGGVKNQSLEEALHVPLEAGNQLVELDDALKRLGKIDPRQCQIIELRYFGGFGVEETARSMGLSISTVSREQRMAEAWLFRELSRERTAAAG